jgi:hypothetical protein
MGEPNEIVTRGRRQFLRGSGGLLLAIPFLPSLLPRGARAASTAKPRFFVNLSTKNGGSWNENMFPPDSMLTESMTYASRTIRRGDLVPTVSGGQSIISNVVAGATSKMTPRILSKMNVIRGWDMPWALGHHTGGFLGNYARNDGTYGMGKEIPTLDQVMAYSPSFYPDVSGILMRSMHLGSVDANKAVSWYWANAATKSGDIVAIPGTDDNQALFKKIFVAPTAPMTQQRTAVIDRVFQNYQRLRQSNRRLSTSDAQRLDDHLTRLQEIQRRSKVVISCQGVQAPAQSAAPYWVYPGPRGVVNSVPAFQLLNDVIVAAFMCGTCRIATLDADAALAGFTDYQGGYQGTTDFHGLIHLSSQTGDPAIAKTAQSMIYPTWQRYFENVFLDLITKLDVDDGSGSSLLDNALVVWEQEAASITHTTMGMQVVAAGGAGGALKTGSYIDYRNTAISRPFAGGANQIFSPGLVWNQWMGVKLQAMEVQPSEYEIPTFQPSRPAGAGTGGYGWFDDSPATATTQKRGDYVTAFPVMGEIPPYLKGA